MTPTSNDNDVLDDIDRAILHLLQHDARHTTAVEIGDCLGVSDGTVRNRIENLEKEGIIKGYKPVIDYPESGYGYIVRYTCSSDIVGRTEKAEEALEITGVTTVVELMSGHENLEIHGVGQTRDDISRISEELDAIGLDIHSETLVQDYHFQTANYVTTEGKYKDKLKSANKT